MYEGYIRNRRQLWRELSEDPASMDGREPSDTWKSELAIIERGWQRWGYELPLHLYGAFSFVLEDEEEHSLICVRDPLGIKPLFYYVTPDGRLIYGTSIQEVAAHPDYEKAIDPEALQLYMIFGYPVGEKTLYKGIRKLLPGRCMTFRNSCLSISTWYQLSFCPDYSVSEEEWMRRIEDTMRMILKEDQENYAVSDCVSFLSGGVDSSWLLACSGVKHTCGIGYEEAEISESGQAKETAERFSADFTELTIRPEVFFDAIPAVVKNLGLPLADASAVAFALGCQETAKRTAVCLSGEGADEFFAGYHIYGLGEKIGQTGGPPHLGCTGLMEQEAAAKLLGQDQLVPLDELVRDIYKRTEGGEHLSRLLLIDIELWLEGDIYFGVNRSAAANGLQLLLPYSDRRMFELSARIPSDLKWRDGCGKYILRKTAEQLLPHDTAFRKKTGFAVPVKIWMTREPIRAGIEEAFLGETAASFFDRNRLMNFWHSYLAGNKQLWQAVYAAYVFITWYDTCF